MVSNLYAVTATPPDTRKEDDKHHMFADLAVIALQFACGHALTAYRQKLSTQSVCPMRPRSHSGGSSYNGAGLLAENHLK